MKIAILMSSYNGEKYIDAQLKSLAEQTVIDKIKVYIRDDGSKDGTFDIIEKWSKNIDIILYKGKNVGPARSFWDLLMNSDIKADYYLFCDQDDIWDSDKVEKQINVLQEGACLTMCNCRLIDGEDQLVEDVRLNKEPKMTYPRLFVAGVCQGCSMAFTNEFKEYIMAQNINCIPMHDIILNLHALYFGTVVWDNNPLFGYRVHANNVVAKNNKSFIKGLKTTYWNWKNSSKNSMSDVAKELLLHSDNLSKKDRKYLEAVKDYKKSLKNKIYIINHPEIKDCAYKNLRSYKLRILFNLY